MLLLKSSQGHKFVAHLYQSRHERSEKTEDVGHPRQSVYSQSLVLKPSELAFSETARLISSEAPSGKSDQSSTVTFTVALESSASSLMTSSAI